jgi:uncharacterized protein DUF1592/uncharacterized protein DUF1588/uncharacterized protein DUF1585/uncharacterized protein DUF1595
VLVERYMSAAQQISRTAIGDPEIRPVVETYRVSRTLSQDDRTSEELPFGSRGGIAIRHNFPLDGEYVLRVRLQRDNTYAIRGLAKAHRLEVRFDGARLTQFAVGGKLKEPGPGSPADERSAYRAYRMTADEGLEVRTATRAGTRLIGVAFLKSTVVPEGMAPIFPLTSFSYFGNAEAEVAIDSVEIDGPYNATTPTDTPSRRRIFVCRPTSGRDEEPCARTILSKLALRAYRRPVTAHDIDTLLRFYNAGHRDGGFEAGIQLALERMLVSPSFLNRIERDPVDAIPTTFYRITDLELASRLSFFLWSGIPDDELLDLAVRGKLKDPAILNQQVHRMLGDSRSKALVDNFAGQWLYLRNLQAVTPDSRIFPDFDDNLRDAFQRETELFFESLLREDRSVLDLLRANYTFVNERLARHYQIPDVYGSHFRRVELHDDRRRGLLGQGSILMVTSYGTRTSPVLRGKWLLENILGAPPPPPPPDVPALEENDSKGTPLSVRERLERHRKNPACASCHAAMDPLGFALDNFDAIGQWRTHENNVPINASGILPDGNSFDGPVALRELLLTRHDSFVSTVTHKLLTYALGRGVEYYDMPAIRQITHEAASTDYRWSDIIVGIVKSTPFQMRSLP